MHTINIFVSHSFAPEYFAGDLENFRAIVTSAVKKALDNCGPTAKQLISPNFFFDSRQYGEGLNDAIITQLQASDVIIADITGTRPNVLYELGFAQASGASLLIIQNCKVESELRERYMSAAKTLTGPENTVAAKVLLDLAGSAITPTDLQGTLIGSYANVEEVAHLLFDRLSTIFADITRKVSTGTINHVPRCFWFAPSVAEITVVCAPEDDEDKGPYAHEGSDNYIFVDNLEDRDAALEVNKFLSRSFPDAEIYTRGSSLRGVSTSKTNLVIIGGPLNNGEARQFMERLNVRLDYKIPDELPRIDLVTQTGETIGLQVERDQQGLLTLDVGYFGWFRNPLRRTCRVALCQGFQTWGTLAATRVFSDESNGRKNRSLLHTKMQEAGILNLSELDFVEAFFPVPVLESRQADVPDLSDPAAVLVVG